MINKNKKEKIRVIVTGGCGFIGHHVVEHLIKNTNWDIVVIDKLSYASSGFDRLRDIDCFDNKRVRVFAWDLTKPIQENEGLMQEIGKIDYILHLAAESHVDNSITNPDYFVRNNIDSTLALLGYVRTIKDKGLKKFVYFSTDEVYGTAPPGINYKEGDRFNPTNPYSASKAASECACIAYANTYRLPVVITNTMNVIGERQHPEKFLPKVINYVLAGKTLSVHSSPDRKKAGTRFYIHARNVADALLFVLTKTNEFLDNVDASKGKYHIVGEAEIDNLAFAKKIASVIGKPLKYEMVDFHSSRPGHDLRYGLNGSKLAKLGWKPPVSLNESIERTVKWSIKRKKWLEWK